MKIGSEWKMAAVAIAPPVFVKETLSDPLPTQAI